MHDVYIGGAMGGRLVSEVLAERMAAKTLLREAGLSYYDPAEDEGLQAMPIHSRISLNYTLAKMEQFVKKDDFNVDHSRIFLNLTGDMKSDGTSWEMGRAFYLNRSPIIMVSPLRAEKQLIQFSNIKALYLARTVAEAVNQCQIVKRNYSAIYMAMQREEVI